MDIVVFDSQELPIALGALRAIAGAPSPRQVRYLEIISNLHGAELRLPELPNPPLWQLAGTVCDPQHRKRLVQLAVILTMIDGVVTRDAAAEVAALARTLDVEEPAVRTLKKLIVRKALATRFQVMRRILRKFLSEAWRDERFAGVHNVLAGFIGARTEDPVTAARYARLARYPEGSLGRALWDHCHSRNFALPGTRGAIPERILFHDIGHVLSGYDTDPAGEIQQAAFQAGFLRDEGFAFLFFGIIQFHFGMKITPVAEGEVGFFDVDKVMTALARGAACKADLSKWSFWDNAARPVEEILSELAIPPLAERAKAAA